MAFVRLIEASGCGRERGVFVAHEEFELVVFRLGEDEFVVADNACPHASGNLSGGEVSHGVVTCPWHEWQFDVRAGACVHSDKAKLTRYPVEVREGWVFAELVRPY